MALAIPSLLLKQLHTFGSLKNTDRGVEFSVKNRLSDATLTGLLGLKFDGAAVPLEAITIDLGGEKTMTPNELTADPLAFPLRQTLDIVAAIDPLSVGKHSIEIRFDSDPFGTLKLKVEDAIVEKAERRKQIPRSPTNDYSQEAVDARREFVESYTGAELNHVSHFSSKNNKLSQLPPYFFGAHMT